MMGDAGGTDLLNIYNTGSKQMQGGSSDRFKKIDNPHQTGALRPGDTLHTEGHIRIVTRVGANSDGNAKFMTAESSSASDDVGPVARVWRFQGAQLQRERSGNWEDSTANRWTNYTETVTFGRYRGVEKLREEQTQHDLPPPPKPVERPMLRRGDRGSDVSDLQDMLNARPMIEPKLNVDGVFGKKTDAAVRQFQKTEHLSVDGIVGPRTWGALLNSPSPKPKPTPNGDLPPAPNPMAQRVKPGTAGKHEGVGNYVVYQDEVRTGGTLAWRNTNPGNIIRGQFATAHGAIGYNNRFAVFPDEATGMAAIVALLRTPKYQALTVLDAMKRYAPPEDNNDPVAYANHIHQLTGIEPSRAMSSLSDAELEAMAGAIRKVEGWKEGTIYRRGRGSPAWVAPLLGSE
jgi:peptidoglycan hydrolase-like protein with peptidoglycan-binding domain